MRENKQTFEGGKIPPHAIEIEDSLIGSLMIDSEYFDQVACIVNEKSFYKESNAIIFKAISELYAENSSIDLMTVTNRLRENSELEKAGSFIGVTNLANLGSFSANLEHYARIVADMYVKREIILKCLEIANKAYDESFDVEDLITEFQKSSTDLEKHFDTIDDGFSNQEVAKSTLEGIFKDVDKYRKNITPGIDSGFIEFNMMTGGFRESAFYILAARPGVGKTSVAIKHILTAAKKGEWVNFFSFEMTKEQIFRIIIAGEGDIDRENVRDGKLNDDELKQINAIVGNIEKLPIIWYTKPMNVLNIKRRAKRNHKKGKCSIVVLDYLQLIHPVDSKIIREQQISEISRELKELTKELEIPVIALSQLNRTAETEIPKLSHLRESGAIEQDADVVTFLYKEIDGERNELSYSMIIAKARNGKTGMFEIWHNDQMTKFGNKGTEIDYDRFNYNPNQHFEPSSKITVNSEFDELPY